MKYYRIIFVFGLWIIIVPFLGVPVLAQKILLIIPGVIFVFMGILMSQEYHRDGSETGISFMDSNPQEKILESFDEPEELIEEDEDFQEEESPLDAKDDEPLEHRNYPLEGEEPRRY